MIPPEDVPAACRTRDQVGCSCTRGPDYEGPAVTCDVHGQPSEAYKAGYRDAQRDIAAEIESVAPGFVAASEGGFEFGLKTAYVVARGSDHD